MTDGALAEGRVVRTILTVLGAAVAAYFAISLSTVLDQSGYVHPAWLWTAVAIVFGAPPVFAAVSYVITLRSIRIALAVYAALFLAVVITWIPAMEGGIMPPESAPWPLGITALGTVPAALAFGPVLAWATVVANAITLAVVRFFAGGGTEIAVSLQDGLFSIAFSSIFTAVAIVAIRSARALDDAAALARSNAAGAASVEARAYEQARLDALVHDEVITSLSYASRDQPEMANLVREQARRALDELARLGNEERESEPVAVADFVHRVRSIMLDLAPEIPFTSVGSRTAEIPAAVAAAFAEGAAEAVRNSLRHAPGSTRRVSLSLRDRIALDVIDDGPGFDPAAVDPYRLGIAVSIRARMDAVPGGRASVTSNPGRGTRVSLTWAAS